MSSIPVIAFSAFSGTGKTTLIEKIIRCLCRRGLRVAAIKHDAHDFEIDHEGKDSYRFTHAGAETVAIYSETHAAIMLRKKLTAGDIISQITDADLILMEGNKYIAYPRIGICRKATGKGLPDETSAYIALVTDDESLKGCERRFGLDEVESICDFIEDYIGYGKGVPNEADFTHFGNDGRARMVNVGEKPETHRSATAAARVLVSRETFALIQSGGMKKGDVLTVAQIAGIMGAKRTPDLIPMCHPIGISGIDLHLHLNEARCSVEIEATVQCDGKTGVEMEALTAAGTAALTVYDMCKAVQKDMVIADLRLVEKTGGVHGDYHRKDE